MKRIALVLSYLAWACEGRRVQTAGERSESSSPLSERTAPSQLKQAFNPSARAVRPWRDKPVVHRFPVMRDEGNLYNEQGDQLKLMSEKELRETAVDLAGISMENAREMSKAQLRETIEESRHTPWKERPEGSGADGLPGKSKADQDAEIRRLPSKEDFWGLPEGLAIALENSGIKQLNDMQRVALSRALDGKDVIVHGETGSGKTLTYVLPILAKHSWHDMGLQAIVITPSLELAAQVAHVFNLLRPETAEALTLDMEELPDTPVLIGPPKMLLEWVKGHRAPLSVDVLKTVKTVAVDEADFLLKANGKFATRTQVSHRNRHPPESELLCRHLAAIHGGDIQVFAASATMGRPVRRLLGGLFGRETMAGIDFREFEVIRGNSIGHILVEENVYMQRQVILPASVSVQVVTTNHEDMLTAVHEVLANEEARNPAIFIPEGRSILKETDLLRRSGINAVSIEQAIYDKSADERASLAAPTVDVNSGQLLVANPRGCRGLDVHGIDLVIIMGSPANTDAFLHMAGRTGRQGAKGRVVIITTRKDADAKLPTISSHIRLDLSADRIHSYNHDSVLADMWLSHSKQYSVNNPEKFVMQMERLPKQSYEQLKERQALDVRKAAFTKQAVLGQRAFKKKLSRKAKKRVNRKKRQAEWNLRQKLGDLPAPTETQSLVSQ